MLEHLQNSRNRGKVVTPKTYTGIYIPAHSLTWLGTGTSIKSGWVKLVL
jgi:hypothetical protein